MPYHVKPIPKKVYMITRKFKDVYPGTVFYWNDEKFLKLALRYSDGWDSVRLPDEEQDSPGLLSGFYDYQEVQQKK